MAIFIVHTKNFKRLDSKKKSYKQIFDLILVLKYKY